MSRDERIRHSDAETMCRKLGIKPSYEQRAAMAALEAIGQRFCIDFGYMNCVAKAEALSESEMQTLFGAPERR